MVGKKTFFLITCLSLVLKLSLFYYAVVYVPESKTLVDSHDYLRASPLLANDGIFGYVDDLGKIRHEGFRTPGYPLFLAITHHALKWPLEVVLLIQVTFTLLSAFFVYQAAKLIDERIARLSALIIIIDPATTVYSLFILTETLFTFILSIFLYFTVRYLHSKELRHLVIAAILLATATYVRPISLYLGVASAFVISLIRSKEGIAKSMGHAIIFLAVFHLLIGVWQYRNWQRFEKFEFTSIGQVTLGSDGIVGKYERETDPQIKSISPAVYYAKTASRGFLSLMTRPVSLKYFKSDELKAVGKLFSYPWIVFWFCGLLVGVFRLRDNPHLVFLAAVIVYFIAAVLAGALSGAGPRFRVSMMPFIAILSSYGWVWLKYWKREGAE